VQVNIQILITAGLLVGNRNSKNNPDNHPVDIQKPKTNIDMTGWYNVHLQGKKYHLLLDECPKT